MESNFIVYNASAGSGKTYTITKEYLCILFKSSNLYTYQNILAITFTNKAASEMKTRILDALVGFSGIDHSLLDTNLLRDIESETGLSGLEIEKKSLLILRILISNYADFEVSTIDSFNHRIIRTFARDLRISQHFSIELDAEDYLQKAVDRLIDEIGQDERLTKILTEFVQFKIDNGSSGDIRYALQGFAKLVLNEINYKPLKILQSMGLNDFQSAQQKTRKTYKEVCKELNQLDLDFHALLKSNGIEESSFPRQTVPKYFKKIRSKDFNFDLISEAVSEMSFCKASATADQHQKIEQIRPQIEAFLHSLIFLINEYKLVKGILSSMTPLAMISQIQQKLNALKAEEEVLFPNDFNRLIDSQVAQQPAPFIYERLGEKFRHYFIDEFQDTSRLQWDNMIPLIEHALTSESDFSNTNNLYLVGDVKQSIYEWRGGDAQLLLDIYFKHTQPFSVVSQNKELNKNWRSAKEIVKFNNHFFEYASNLLSDPDYKTIYQNVSQNITKDVQGYVELAFIDDSLTQEDLSNRRISLIVSRIEDVLTKGYSLSDICIIVRTNKQGVEIAEALTNLEQPIPIVSQESLLIKNDFKVEIIHLFLSLISDFTLEHKFDFLLSWFTYINLPKDEIDKAFKRLKSLDHSKFFSAIQNYDINFELKQYEILPFYNKVEYLIRCLNFDNNANAYLQFYLDEVLLFSKSNSQDASEFLMHWELKKDKLSISTSEAADAVKIMTIHKSKGIEFPIVLYAYANFKLSALSNQFKDWIPINEYDYGIPLTYHNISKRAVALGEEFRLAYERNVSKTELANINAAYVCMTRAKHQLHILVEPYETKNDIDFRKMLEGFLKSEHKFIEGESLYSFGTPQEVAHKKDKVDPQNSLCNSFKASRFLNTITHNKTKESQSIEIDYGIKIHKALEHVTYASTYRAQSIDCEFHTAINQVLQNKDIKGYFKKPWKIYNEVEVIYANTIHRIDRLCIHGNNAVIIDYKTGLETPKDIQQITTYKNAVESLGYISLKAYLVYIRKTILVKSI